MILIEQTNICNLRCEYCPTRFGVRPRGAMEPAAFRAVVAQLVEHDAAHLDDRVTLHGFGEPLLSPHLWANLETLDRAGFRTVDFSTNGMFLGSVEREALASFSCLRWLRVSLNSSRWALFARLNTGSEFGTVVENIQALLASRPPYEVVLQCMSTTANPDETLEEYEALFGQGTFRFLRKRLHTSRGQVPAGPLAVPADDMSGCVFGSGLHIHWDGDLVGCCGDNTKSQVYGNVRDGIFSDSVQSRRRAMQAALAGKNLENLPLCRSCLK